MPTYFVTGATGFIGRHLLERLLEREGDIHVLVREGSAEKLDAIAARLGGDGRIHAVAGDLSEPLLGVDAATRDALRGNVDHFFHLAAIYDMTADEDAERAAQRRRHAERVELANDLQRGHLPSRVLDRRRRRLRGPLHRGHVRRGPEAALAVPPDQVRVREDRARASPGAWRVYRPAIVVGDSRTGEMDKIDGPYYFFKAIQKAAPRAAGVVPAVSASRSAGRTSCRSTGSPPRWTTSRTSPTSTARRSTSSTRARSAPATCSTRSPAPATRRRWCMRVDKRMTDMLPKGVLSYAMKLPALKDIRRTLLADLGIPDARARAHGARAAVRRARHAARAEGHRHRGAAARDLRREAVGLLGAQPRPRPVQGPLVRGRGQRQDRRDHGRVERDRPRRGAQDRRRRRDPAAGRAHRRRSSRRSRPRSSATGGTAYVYSADLSDYDSIDACVAQIFADHASVDVLVNNAGRSIRRSVALSYDRFHDYERTIKLNYLGTIRLILGLLPHMREKQSGHIVNVSSIGVQTNPPRFSAYVASKSALDALHARRELGDDRRQRHASRRSTCRSCATAMIAPTKMYDSFPTISARRGRRPDLRGDPRQAEADQHPARHVRRGALRARARRPSTRSCTWPTRCSRSRRRRRARRGRRSGPRARRPRSRT